MLLLTAPKNTLRYQLGARPMTMHLDQSSTPLEATVKRLNGFMSSNNSNVAPEAEALWFYMLNHAVAEVRKRVHLDQPLGQYAIVLEAYGKALPMRAARLFYYLLLICTRESRHVHNSSGSAFWDNHANKFGSKLSNFQKAIKGTGSSGAADYLKNNPPKVTIGEYVDSLRYVFYKGGYSGGYGGPKWGQVTDAMVEFVHGRYTAEMMLDVGWTLCHNGGPIFNKGMLYKTYSHGPLNKILDVQRAGQIPQLICDTQSGNAPDVHKYVTQPMGAVFHNIQGILGDDVFGGYVDWWLVEALGSLGSYKSEKNNQASIHGPSFKAEQAEAKVAAEKAVKAKKESALYFIVGHDAHGQKIKVEKTTRPQHD